MDHKHKITGQMNKENKHTKKHTKHINAAKITEMLAETEKHFNAFQFVEACNICDEVLTMNPNNCNALEMRASIAIEMDQIDTAEHCLDKAISLEPFSGHSKFLSRAQLTTGEQALNYYKKGLELIKVTISQCPKAGSSETEEAMDTDGPSSADEAEQTDGDKLAQLKYELCSIHCNIAELYLTDLCDLDDAEDSCTAAIQKGIEADQQNPEPYIIKARYEIITGDQDAAKASISKSASMWCPDAVLTPAEQLLCASARLDTAKVMIEVQDHDKAQFVLDTLMEEDEEVVEVWYLMGWNSYLEGKEHYEQAKKYLIKAKKVHRACPCDDEEILGHIDKLLFELGVSGDSTAHDDSSDSEYEDLDDEEELEREILENAQKNGN